MPRSSRPVDDRTPIAGSRMDVGARVGWLLRTHRTVAGVSLREMSAALLEQGVRLSPASLSRIEGEGQLSPAALDGYAAVLGLPAGSLRTPAENLWQSFARTSIPIDSEPVTLARFSHTYDLISSGAATAGDWLEFARMHHGGSGFGLPARLMEREVERLAAEMARSVTAPRFTRRQAVMVLRRSAYAEVVADVAGRLVADPESQGHWDMMDTLCARPTPELVVWGGDLLSDASTYTVLGATFLLQALLLRGGLSLEDWLPLAPRLARAWQRAGDDATRRGGLGELYNALPPPLREKALAAGCCPDPTDRPAPRRWSRDRGNRHYVYAESLALEACARRGRPDEPLLARLLFEAFFDPRGVRRSNAQALFLASPFSADVARLVPARRDAAPDRASWLAALRVAAFCHVGGHVSGDDGLDRLLATDDPEELLHALSIASRLDDGLPDAAVERGLGGDEMLVRRTLYCLGMQGDDVRLKEIEVDPSRPAWVRGGARWWRAQGPRLAD